MAEIKIEKKKPVWPWILVIIIIIGVLIYLFAFNDDESDERQEDNTEQRMQESENTEQSVLDNAEVAAYVTLINNDLDEMGLDHEFTNEALSKLTKATTAMAGEIDYDVRKDMEELSTYTTKITQDPFETSHANSISKAAEILANVLQNMQQKAFSEWSNEAKEVQKAAKAITPDALTLDQKQDVKNFFRTSANLLEKMNTNSPEM